MSQNSTWSAPEGFLPLESQLEGVTVYAPKPPAIEKLSAVSYKCPNCGATTRYDIGAGGVACEHCGYSQPAAVQKVGRAADEFEFTLENVAAAEQGWGIERKEMLCDSCGASLSIPEGALSVTCPFCASNRVNIRQAPAAILRPRFLVPFKIQPDGLRSACSTWLKQGWFHPAELSATAVLSHFTGIYMPFWTFDCQIQADWKAEVGYERTESYYDAGDKTWKTRTRIDWRWENGQVGLPTDDQLIPGSTHLSWRILERILDFRLNELVAYTPDFLAGWQAHAYDISLEKAWDTAKEILRERSKDACYKDIPTSHVRNFSMVADYQDETWRFVLLPVYISAYRFQEKVYQVMVNGQTGTIAGQKPVAWWKIWLAIGGLLTPGLALSLIGVLTLVLGGLGVIPLIFGILLLVGGAALALMIYKQAIQSEAA